MKVHISTVLFLSFFSANAQFPETDVWLFKLGTDKDKNLQFIEANNISNRKGYDNQPSFSPDGKKLFYVSMVENQQTDIVSYDLKRKKITSVTRTDESEYSPVNYLNNETLSAVVVEKDSAQRIHFIDVLTGNHTKRLDIDSIGYYHFVNSDTVVYYKLTAPHSLRFYVQSSKEDKLICTSPTRSIKKINRHEFLFGIKDSLKVVYYRYDFLLRKAEKLAQAPVEADDALWHKQWGLMISDKDKILRYDKASNIWITHFDLSTFGLKKITRFAFDEQGKYLAVTENE